MKEETYNVHIKFTSGDRHIEPNKNWRQVMSAISRLHNGPAAKLGLIQEVRIVDMMDCVIFLSENGKVCDPENPQIDRYVFIEQE